MDSTQSKIPAAESPKFTPIIAPSYSPEIELMLNVGGLFTFQTQPRGSTLQRSSIPFSIGYSTNKSLSINFRPFIYWKKDRIRLSGDIWIRDMPDNYWGAGYKNGKRVSDPDSTTHYSRQWRQVYLNTVFRMGSRVFAGFNIDINGTNANEVSHYILNDPQIRQFGTEVRNTGLGLILQYDTRDVAVNAYSGVYLSLMVTFYGNYLGGENKYNIFQLDYRHFLKIRREGRTLAWQIKNRVCTGEVPWPEMSQLGTPFDLRGYRWGRYRDRNMLFGILEYRHMFMRKSPNKKGSLQSRSGFVAWIGTGTISETPGDMKYWLPNGGVGYRFEIQSRMNARVDFGIGEDSSSFYVSFNEAF